jgi:hypothetical protein
MYVVILHTSRGLLCLPMYCGLMYIPYRSGSRCLGRKWQPYINASTVYCELDCDMQPRAGPPYAYVYVYVPTYVCM